MSRQMIVNADDFGLSAGVNRGVIEAHRRGIVTSASLMVRWPSSAEAAALAAANPALGVGLHIDLGEWYWADGTWPARYEVVDLADSELVTVEIERQVEWFVRLLGRLPTHVDSHQHVHNDPFVRPVVARVGQRLGVPVRGTSPGLAYCGSFYGQDGRGFEVPEAITVEALVAIIAALPDGVTEVACHAGYGDGLDTTYRHERARELVALCDPQVRSALETHGVELISFVDVVERNRGSWGAGGAAIEDGC
jgi:predicted glycoside hydrolase/deacetylase ChbG (UPF0249 family)